MISFLCFLLGLSFNWEDLSNTQDTVLSHIPGADPENSERGGRVPPLPCPPLEWKLHFSGDAPYSIMSVFMMQSKVTLTLRKIESKSILLNDFQSKIVRHFENTRKKGGPRPHRPLP